MTLRLDSEYYFKKYISNENLSKDKDMMPLCYYDIEIDASAFYPSLEPYYNQGDIPFLRVADIDFFVDYDNCIRIPKMHSNFNTLKRAVEGDIVLTKGGTIGRVGRVEQESYVTRDLILLRTSKLNRSDNIALLFFLNSKFSYENMLRTSSQSVQPHLTLTMIKELPIMIFSDNLKYKLESIYNIINNKRRDLEKLYQQAESTLLEELKLNDYEPSQANISVKSLSSSFLESGRLDAEYYQPKYDEIINYFTNYNKFSDVINLYDTNYTPDTVSFYKYIELSNIGSNGEVTGHMCEKEDALPSRARRKVKEGQVIISSIEGSLNKCALIDKKYNNALCSTGFYVIASDVINSETLLVLFKSTPMQKLLKQSCSGTILTSINKDDLRNIPIPFINESTQKRISSKIQESFNLKEQSELLHKSAIKAVEIAIEKDEEAAIAWLENVEVEIEAE